MDQLSELSECTDPTSFYAAMIDNAVEGICVCHAIDEFPFIRFSIWNARMTEITGYTLEEINREGWYQSVCPDPILQQKAIERMRLMRDRGDLFNEQTEIMRKDGQNIKVRISTSLLETDNDTPQVLAFMQDITEQVQTAALAKRQAGVNKLLVCIITIT